MSQDERAVVNVNGCGCTTLLLVITIIVVSYFLISTWNKNIQMTYELKKLELSTQAYKQTNTKEGVEK